MGAGRIESVELVKPDERLILLMDEIIRQNAIILRMNDVLMTLLCHPVMRVKSSDASGQD